MTCRHCQRRMANAARGLCQPCHRQRDIREQYPLTTKWGQRGENPTPEEIARLCAEIRRERGITDDIGTRHDDCKD